MKIQFPLSYSWFVLKELTNIDPWYFIDDSESIIKSPNFSKKANFNEQFKIETGADFEVYLFARRQDRDDFAFFVVRDGKIEDKVIRCHLSFSSKMELRIPYTVDDVQHTFMSWIKGVVLEDIEEGMSVEDLIEDYE